MSFLHSGFMTFITQIQFCARKMNNVSTASFPRSAQCSDGFQKFKIQIAVNRPSATGLRPAPDRPRPVFLAEPVFQFLGFLSLQFLRPTSWTTYDAIPTLGAQDHAPSCSYIASCQTVPEVPLYFSSSFLNSWPDFQLIAGELGPPIDAKIDFQ